MVFCLGQSLHDPYLCYLQGTGCGELQLRMHYRALETLNQREMASAYKGVVTVRVSEGAGIMNTPTTLFFFSHSMAASASLGRGCVAAGGHSFWPLPACR